MSDTDDCPFDGVVPTVQRPPQVAAAAPAAFESELERIANTPYESLSFKDFAKLRSGRDPFSRMKLPELRDSVSATDWSLIVAAFGEDATTQAACIRWMLRGLDCNKAIRKLQTDIEISKKAVSRWKK